MEPKEANLSDSSAETIVDAAATIEVGWSEPESDDPANPLNWSSRKKWTNILTISVISFLVPLVSSMLAPAVQSVMDDFGTASDRFATFVVSIFVLGFACGPLLLAPLSELYGRVVVYHCTNALFCAFTVGCALAKGEAMLLAFRFLSGFAGVATITIGSGTIADGGLGLVGGDDSGAHGWAYYWGYVADVHGWRWMFWIMAIVVGVVTVFAYFVLEETSKLALDLTPGQLFARSILRPTKMLLCCPIVTVMCTYVAILYGTLYLLFSTYSFVFKEVYNFSTTAAGLVFLAGGFGTLAGLGYIANFSDRNVKSCAAAGKPVTPEARLPLIITVPGALTFPLGLFIYGWSAEARAHWIVPQLGTAVTGFGSILVFVAVQTYLIDAFEGHAASVVGANAVLRGLAGALIPLGGLGLYDALGWGWGNSLLGFVALVFAPVLWVLGARGRGYGG
ncbi:major facilitator superfamily transporter [Apiospora hydei]|uniref:Major facilitator superfamily transporter n=1 Tax=Apiospora hydei TaxID=1337664 RepID=A0ABR1WPR8_9PEZI